MADYKQTINLPQTGFPMKADLANREPVMLAAWEREGLYQKIRAVSKGRPGYVLTDGPPYANGAIHLVCHTHPRCRPARAAAHHLDRELSA